MSIITTHAQNWEKAGLGNGQGRKFGYGVLAVLACIFMNVHWASVEEDNEGRSSVYSVLSNLLTFVCICLGLELRIKVRAAYGIQGSACEDCCCHWFCNPCALAQEERHINRVNMSAQQGQAAPVAMVAYGQQQQQPYVQTLAPR
jgi:Cys-rich protein (TIGR01571 family)